MDWVHCNNCFQLPDREKCFFLTSCGHIFCRDCEGTCARDVCKLCGNQCSSIPLSSSMKPDVQVFFTDPDDLLKAKLKEVQKISMFQRNHRARLMTYYRKELNKYRQMKDAFKKLLKNLKDLESERKQLSKENDAFKKLMEMSGLSRSLSTPSSCAGITPGSRKGSMITPHNATPASGHVNPMFSHFFNKLENPGCSVPSAGRVSVFSPPVNGKIGGIPRSSSPSPSTGLRNLNLSSADSCLPAQKGTKNKDFLTPTDSQTLGSQDTEYAFNIPTQSSTSSPTEQEKNYFEECYSKLDSATVEWGISVMNFDGNCTKIEKPFTLMDFPDMVGIWCTFLKEARIECLGDVEKQLKSYMGTMAASLDAGQKEEMMGFQNGIRCLRESSETCARGKDSCIF